MFSRIFFYILDKYDDFDFKDFKKSTATKLLEFKTKSTELYKNIKPTLKATLIDFIKLLIKSIKTSAYWCLDAFDFLYKAAKNYIKAVFTLLFTHLVEIQIKNKILKRLVVILSVFIILNVTSRVFFKEDYLILFIGYYLVIVKHAFAFAWAKLYMIFLTSKASSLIFWLKANCFNPCASFVLLTIKVFFEVFFIVHLEEKLLLAVIVSFFLLIYYSFVSGKLDKLSDEEYKHPTTFSNKLVDPRPKFNFKVFNLLKYLKIVLVSPKSLFLLLKVKIKKIALFLINIA